MIYALMVYAVMLFAFAPEPADDHGCITDYECEVEYDQDY